MTIVETCPDQGTLSQLVDDELSAALGAAVRRHVEQCSRCGTRVATLDRAATAGRMAASHLRTTSALTPAGDCLSDAQLASYATNALEADEMQRAEAHLEQCDLCLVSTRQAIGVTRGLADAAVTVPPSLRERVASQWPERTSAVARLAIEVRRRSLRFLEQHLAPPLLSIEPQLVALPAHRAGDAGTALSIRLRAEEAEIHATLVPEDGLVGVTVLLLGQEGAPLRGQRLHVRQEGGSVFSARTDANGELRLPRLEAGDYDVVCPGINTTFRLELRT